MHEVDSGGYRNKAMGGGRLYWRGGIFQRRRNVFNVGGADFVKLLTGGGGCSPLRRGGGGGGGCSPLTTGGGGGGGGPKYTSAPPPIRLGGPRPPLPPRFLRLCILERALLPPTLHV